MGLRHSLQAIGFVSLGGMALVGCAAAPDSEESEDLGSAELSLVQVPSSVLCIRVVATGSTTVTTNLSVTAGSSTASLNLGRLASGNTQFSAQAFDTACTSVGSTAPSWISDPASAVIRAGVATAVSLTFRPNNPVTVNANFVANVGSVAVGRFATYVRMADGSVRFFGADTAAGWSLSPSTAPMYGLSDIAELGSGTNFQCARRTSGSVTCWGFINSQNSSIGMTQVNLSSPAIQLSVGDRHACAVMQSGQVACWGSSNVDGRLGNGTTTAAPLTAPAIVSNLNSVARVYAGTNTTCALTGYGSVYCWGDNSSAQFGNGNTTSSLVPVAALSTLRGVTDIALGFNHGCAKRGDGALFCWGSNTVGQVGDGSTTTRLAPVQVTLSNVSRIAAGLMYTCAISSGTLYCWGFNQDGELGNGTGVDSNRPVAALGITNVTEVKLAGEAYHSCATTADQSLYCWGGNANGELGTGDRMPSSVPLKVILQ